MQKEIYIKFNEKYSISNFGNIKNIKTNKILKLRKNTNGYLKTNISVNGKIITVFPHRLVAEKFLNNNNINLQVNHIDGNKENNNINNLEFITSSENIKHAYKLGLNKGNGKKVIQLDDKNNIINEFNSTKQAEKYLGCSDNCSKVNICCNNKRKSHKGYFWKYK